MYDEARTAGDRRQKRRKKKQQEEPRPCMECPMCEEGHYERCRNVK